MPEDFLAVSRILHIKKRNPGMGLVVIVSDIDQLMHWVAPRTPRIALPSSDIRPVTWILPASDEVPWWIRGEHLGIAVRQTTHPIASKLCESANSALISTSANISGRPPARNVHILRRLFGTLVDYIVPGDCGPATGPSEIRDFETGKILRPV